MADDKDGPSGSENAPRGSVLTGDGKGLRRAVLLAAGALLIAAVVLLFQFLISLSDMAFPDDGGRREPRIVVMPRQTDPNALPRRARLSTGSVVTADYPPEARRRGEEGRVVMRFLVDTDGRVRECTIEISSGSAILDEASCALLTRRFRFEPARDARGRAVPERKTQAIRWVLAR